MSGSTARADRPCWLFQLEDPGSFAVFRVLWGIVLAFDAGRYLLAGWPHKYFVKPAMLFKYVGFEWVIPLPGSGMVAVFAAMVVCGCAVALGVAYRAASILLFLGHTYTFLLSATNYLNHAYLLCILTFLMIFMPANSAVALRPKSKRRTLIPRWPRALLLAQLGIVYTYGGIAKLNPDWMAGMPIRRWMQSAASRVPFGAEFVRAPWFTYTVQWYGIVFDLCIVPLLLWRKTRAVAVVAAAAFHLSNSVLFKIGVFPWLMLAATTLFLEPGWPRRIPWVGPALGRIIDSGHSPVEPSGALRRRVLAAVSIWLIIQVLVPLRHHLYPGDVAWTEEGHYFAWRMKLRSKSGRARFAVRNPATGETWTVDPADELTKRQSRKMVSKPDLILQYAHHLDRRYSALTGVDVEVRAKVWVSLNYRGRRPLIDPDVDLSREPASLLPYRWILHPRLGPLPAA